MCFMYFQISLIQFHCCLENNEESNELFSFQPFRHKEALENFWYFCSLRQQWSLKKKYAISHKIRNCFLD